MRKWLEKIKAQAEQAMTAKSVDVDYSRFNDEFSRRVDWSPLKPGGSNFGTHYLVTPESGGRTLIFKATYGGLVFGFSFLLIGLASLALVLWQSMTGHGAHLVIFALLIGLTFSVVGVLLLNWLTKPRVFDLVAREFYCGFRRPKADRRTNLNKVKALQLITENIKSNKSRYSSYEINLVLDDTTRVHVVDHGHYERILLDAEELAKALHIPLWDNS